MRRELAASVPDDLRPVLRGLHPSGLRVFAGPPDVFDAVFARLDGGGSALHLEFFGTVRARWHGRPVDLPPRMREVALALTLLPTASIATR